MRIKTAFEWQTECKYISAVTDMRGNVPEMNNDKETFIRYCEMQQSAAVKDGFFDVAEYIGHCIYDIRA